MLVDNVEEIKWNTASFKRLVLPSDYKELILAFVDSHLSQGDGFDDIVQGKGRGIVGAGRWDGWLLVSRPGGASLAWTEK